MTNLTFRTADTSDIELLQTLFITAIKGSCSQDYSPKEIEVWTNSTKRTERWLTAIREQYFIIAQINDKAVGFGSLLNDNYIDFMYVSPNHQGRGIAKAILEKLIQKAKSLGSQFIESDVSITAKPFFINQGFKALHQNKNEHDGVILINYRLKKAL